VSRRRVVLTSRAHRDLLNLDDRFARRVGVHLRLLETPPWPPGKVKKLRGCDFWEIRSGDFRAVFWPRGKEVVVLRVVNRRDLERALGGIDRRAIEKWVEGREE
jgi:mRNA-degrading endonuclease RelE of RelBE toxin-antitoxin system